MTIITKQGAIEGVKENNCIIYKGVPYAKAPVGELRFKVPQPLDPYKGIYKADKWANQCPQISILDGLYGKEFYTDPKYPLPPMSEDCLYLNIWTPEDAKHCPVCIWIHGGAFDHGFAHEMEFDGEAYAKKGIIYVSINYRVGVFGFLASEEAMAEDEHHTTGNYGLLDQIAALKWVKENIEAFGGDPDNITLFGQSAGAMSVQTLITSPLSKGLVKQAIMQSAAGYYETFDMSRTLEQALKTGKKVFELCKVKTLAELRKVSADKFLEILPLLNEEGMELPFGPVVDGYLLTENFKAAIDNKHVADIPVMIGCVTNDIRVLPEQDVHESEIYKGCIEFAKRHASNTYVYWFNRSLPGEDHPGSFHSSELWYMMGTLDRCWRPMSEADHALSKTMVNDWSTVMNGKAPFEAYKVKGFVKEYNV